MGATADPGDALKQITTGDLGTGGTLPREMFDEFFTEVQDESNVLSRVRTVPIGTSKTRIPKIGVGTRLRSAQAENTGQTESGVTTDYVDIDAEKASIYWSLTRETVEENPERESLANTILSLMANQWSVDTEDLGWVGDAADADPFVAQNDGWLAIAAAGGSPVYYNTHNETPNDGSADSGTPEPPDVDTFHNAIQAMPDKYLRNDPVFFMNRKQLQEFYSGLTGRGDGLGAAVLMGDTDVTPFSHDIVGTSLMPQDQMVFTAPENLVYAMRYDLRVDVLRESDDVFDNDLHAKYKIVGKDDFAIEDAGGVVRVEDMAAV